MHHAYQNAELHLPYIHFSTIDKKLKMHELAQTLFQKVSAWDHLRSQMRVVILRKHCRSLFLIQKLNFRQTEHGQELNPIDFQFPPTMAYFLQSNLHRLYKQRLHLDQILKNFRLKLDLSILQLMTELLCHNHPISSATLFDTVSQKRSNMQQSPQHQHLVENQK